MLNSTKTWQEEFDEKFEEATIPIETDSGWATNSCSEEIKQFISDLRKRDMEALIGMLPEDDNSETFLYRNRVKKIIRNYYEN